MNEKIPRTYSCLCLGLSGIEQTLLLVDSLLFLNAFWVDSLFILVDFPSVMVESLLFFQEAVLSLLIELPPYIG